MSPSSRPVVAYLLCAGALVGCARFGFRDGAQHDARVDLGSVADGQLHDGPADVHRPDSGTTDRSLVDAALSDGIPRDHGGVDAGALDQEIADVAAVDQARGDASLIDATSTIRHVSVACDPGERVVGGSATCSSTQPLRITQPVAVGGWTQRCGTNPAERSPAICADGALTTAVQVDRPGTATSTSANCGVGMRLIGGGCACGVGNVAASFNNEPFWTCGCTQTPSDATSSALCIEDAIAAALGLTMVETVGSATSATATCPAGKVIIGGGCEAAPGSIFVGYFVALLQHRYEPPNSWFCERAAGSTALTVQAICIDER